MPDTTLEHFSELASCIAMNEYPILPKPHWGQDAALIAFFVDGMRQANAELREICEDAALLLEALGETGAIYDRLKAACEVID